MQEKATARRVIKREESLTRLEVHLCSALVNLELFATNKLDFWHIKALLKLQKRNHNRW